MQMVSRVVSSVLLGLALAMPASAQVCGNGIRELGEACDDGNVVAGDCCHPTCGLVARAGTACRPAVDPCDVIEVCDGVSGICPPDTGIVGDGDGDGLCDPLDDCPDVADLDQIDRDLDGLGDACDPCTNVDEIELTSARVRLRKLNWPFGSQRVLLRGEMEVSPSPAIDPLANGIRLIVTDKTGLVVLDVTVPGGEYDPVTRRGWTALGTGVAFRYRDKDGTAGGIKRMTVKLKAPGHLNVIAFGQDGEYLRPASAEADLAIIADPPLGDTQCGEAHFGPGDCRYRNGGAKFVCR